MQYCPGPSLAATVCLLIALTSLSCGKSEKRAVPTLTLFKVKPFAALAPLPVSASTSDLGSISLRAAPLLTDEETQELFEANLQLAGLLPIRMELIHNSGDAIDISKIKFRMHDSKGTEWRLLSIKQALSRILKANDVYAYNPTARKTFEKEFGEYELNLKGPLTHSERRRAGFLFFQSPAKQTVASPHGLTLSIEGLAQPVTLRFN